MLMRTAARAEDLGDGDEAGKPGRRRRRTTGGAGLGLIETTTATVGDIDHQVLASRGEPFCRDVRRVGGKAGPKRRMRSGSKWGRTDGRAGCDGRVAARLMDGRTDGWMGGQVTTISRIKVADKATAAFAEIRWRGNKPRRRANKGKQNREITDFVPGDVMRCDSLSVRQLISTASTLLRFYETRPLAFNVWPFVLLRRREETLVDLQNDNGNATVRLNFVLYCTYSQSTHIFLSQYAMTLGFFFRSFLPATGEKSFAKQLHYMDRKKSFQKKTTKIAAS